MTRGRLLDLFPVAFRPPVWFPMITLTLTLALLNSFGRASNPFHPFQVSLDIALSLFCLAPLLIPPLRSMPSLLRRFMVGVVLQLLIAAVLLLCSSFPPGLLLANAFFVFRVLGLSKRPALEGAGLAGVLLAGGVTIWRGASGWTVATGLLIGWVAYRFAFSMDLAFLEQSQPWPAITHKLKDLSNIVLGNRRAIWEEAYAAGRWEFLQSVDHRPRHYVIAGIVRDRFAEGGANLLDVGCGYATLYRVLGRHAASYTGIDLSENAIRQCRTAFQDDPRCSFETVGLEAYHPDRTFDVVVLNEVLYYLPIRSIAEVCRSARSLLKDEKSVLIISMGRIPKASRIWRKLDHLMTPVQNIRVTNETTGSYSIVRVYPGVS